jgi:hypothetical protein
MVKGLVFVILVLGGFGIMIWASDRVTLEGERTIYTVACERGVWKDLRCTGLLTAGDRHRFRASSSRKEVLFWIAGSRAPSGKYTDCQVTNRDNWTCNVLADEKPSIAHELSHGRPISRGGGSVLPFHAVAKWKWWALRAQIPGFTEADYASDQSNTNSGK